MFLFSLLLLMLSVLQVMSICVGNNAKYRYIEMSADRKRNNAMAAGAGGSTPSPTPTPTPTTTTSTTTGSTTTTSASTTTTSATTTTSPPTTTTAGTTSTSLATSTTPNNIEERYFKQFIDHFDPRNNAVFSQKYLIDWGSLDPAANYSQTPVFLIISGEGLLDADGLLSNEAAALARKNNAILIALEHRYYGDSIVYNLTQHGLRYLTVEQALADVSNFQSQMSLQGYSGQWFAFGCSYGGVLAAWFRLKYPQQVVASLAASSPVQTIVSFYQLDQLVATAAGPVCARSLRHATAAVEDKLLQNATQTMIDFGCGSLTENVDFLYVIADVVAYGIQMDSKYHFQQAMCKNFTDVPETFLYQVYRDYTAFAFGFTNTTCDDWALSTFTNIVPNRDNFMRQSMWQSCTELGYFQTAPASDSLRSTEITVDYFLQVCKRLFNFNDTRNPATDVMNSIYGGSAEFVGTNVIFSNGANDPWRALSILSPLGPTVPAIVISGQAHCANWYSAAPGDSPALERGRQLVSSYVSYFVNPSAICGKCKNNATCDVTTVGTDSANVTADCTCLEGWVGDNCDQNVYVTAGFYIFIITAGCAIAFGLLGVVIGRILVLRSKPQVI